MLTSVDTDFSQCVCTQIAIIISGNWGDLYNISEVLFGMADEAQAVGIGLLGIKYEGPLPLDVRRLAIIWPATDRADSS